MPLVAVERVVGRGGAMAEDQPLWRQGYDAAERAVAPRLEALVGDERFAVGVGLVTQARRAVQRRTERQMRRTLHLFNLPAGSDVTRLMNEIRKLQQEVRGLSRQLAAEKGEVADDGSGRGKRSPRSRAAGR